MAVSLSTHTNPSPGMERFAFKHVPTREEFIALVNNRLAIPAIVTIDRRSIVRVFGMVANFIQWVNDEKLESNRDPFDFSWANIGVRAARQTREHWLIEVPRPVRSEWVIVSPNLAAAAVWARLERIEPPWLHIESAEGLQDYIDSQGSHYVLNASEVVVLGGEKQLAPDLVQMLKTLGKWPAETGARNRTPRKVRDGAALSSPFVF